MPTGMIEIGGFTPGGFYTGRFDKRVLHEAFVNHVCGDVGIVGPFGVGSGSER